MTGEEFSVLTVEAFLREMKNLVGFELPSATDALRAPKVSGGPGEIRTTFRYGRAPRSEVSGGPSEIRTHDLPLRTRSARRRFLVDLVRFELTTSSMPWKRAPNCATG